MLPTTRAEMSALAAALLEVEEVEARLEVEADSGGGTPDTRRDRRTCPGMVSSRMDGWMDSDRTGWMVMPTDSGPSGGAFAH